MTSQQAKEVLLRYRPESGDATDPEIAAALVAVEADAELRQWFEQHCEFQRQLRAGLRSLPVPPDRPCAAKIVPGPAAWWKRPSMLAAAAAIMITGISVWLWQRPAPAPDQFQNFQTRMARAALREYRMDVHTADITQLRQYQQQRGAPANYIVPNKLSPVPLTGGGVLTWRGKPVSMACFDRGQRQMVFLFVIENSAIPNPPPQSPEFLQISNLMTASWTEGNRTYLLATETEDMNVLKQHL